MDRPGALRLAAVSAASVCPLAQEANPLQRAPSRSPSR